MATKLGARGTNAQLDLVNDEGYRFDPGTEPFRLTGGGLINGETKSIMDQTLTTTEYANGDTMPLGIIPADSTVVLHILADPDEDKLQYKPAGGSWTDLPTDSVYYAEAVEVRYHFVTARAVNDAAVSVGLLYIQQ